MMMRVLSTALLAILAGAISEQARAAQSFVCADGKVITVEAVGLEDAKRHDPCVAAYFGITAVPRLPELPERNPVIAAMRIASPVQDTSGQSRPTRVQGWTAMVGEATGPAVVRPMTPKSEPTLTMRLSQLESGTADRVRVINAATEPSRWFTRGP